jgi:hypothetical protein
VWQEKGVMGQREDKDQEFILWPAKFEIYILATQDIE